MDTARHVIECDSNQETRLQTRLMPWRALSFRLTDSARHVIGYDSTQETRSPNAFDVVASTIHQSSEPSFLEINGDL